MTEAQDRTKGAQHSADEIFALAVKDKEERTKVIASTAGAHLAPTRRRTVLVCLSIALPVLVAVFAVNVYGLSLTRCSRPRRPRQWLSKKAQATLEMLVADVEEFWKDYDELPQSLAEVGRACCADSGAIRSGTGTPIKSAARCTARVVSFAASQPRERRMVREPDQE